MGSRCGAAHKPGECKVVEEKHVRSRNCIAARRTTASWCRRLDCVWIDSRTAQGLCRTPDAVSDVAGTLNALKTAVHLTHRLCLETGLDKQPVDVGCGHKMGPLTDQPSQDGVAVVRRCLKHAGDLSVVWIVTQIGAKCVTAKTNARFVLRSFAGMYTQDVKSKHWRN